VPQEEYEESQLDVNMIIIQNKALGRMSPANSSFQKKVANVDLMMAMKATSPHRKIVVVGE
jgi:hypothetical protein